MTPENDRIRTSQPFGKAVLLALARSAPAYLAFEEIERRALAIAGTDGGAPPEDLAENLLRAGLSNLVRFKRRSPAFARRAPERPLATALARIQAAEDEWVASLLHQLVKPSDLERFLLRRCDGTRDRAALAALVVAAVREGELEGAGPTPSPAERLQAAAE